MWIKICANTSLQDALLAAEAGADAIGFVFAPSPRLVTPRQVGIIVPELPYDLTQIGVFQTQDAAEIVETVRTAGLHGIQLHGPLDLPLAENLRRQLGESLFLIQSLHWSIDRDLAESQELLRDDLRTLAGHGAIDAVLLDAQTATASGGTGKIIDWKSAREVLARESGTLKIILAGGLHPDNVAEAIRTVRPWGVDVASGVEQHPGKKDPARVQAFIRNARVAFAAIEKNPLATTAPR